MGLQTIFDNFELLSDAPNGVAKLRELVLQMAVEGKLVNQHSKDEPASALVKRIAIKKARLVKNKAIRPSKPLLPITPGEIPFRIPSNWSWEKLGNAAIVIQIGPFGSLLHKSDYVRNGTPLVNPSHIKNEKIVSSNDLTIDEKKKARLGNYIMQTGDIVMGRRGEMGKCAIVSETEAGWLCGTGSLFIRVTDDLFRPYLLKLLTSDYVEGCLVEDSVGSTMNNLNQRILKNLLIPIPPLEEQKRIVAKVDDLMGLCDRLEARQRSSRISRVRFNNVTLAPLKAPTLLAPEDFAQATARLGENFDRLYDSAETVRGLRSTILQLSLCGKLVSNGANVEPALQLLKRIQVERARLVSDGKLKKTKPPQTIDDSEIPFELPTLWKWVRLSELCELENGDRSKNYPSRSEFVSHGIPFINAGHLRDGEICFDKMNHIPEERFNLLRTGKVRDGDIVFCLRGSLGKSAIISGIPRGAIASSLVILRLIGEVNRQFVMNFLFSPLASYMIKRFDNGTAQPNLSSEDLGKFLFPLAPLTEQERIVAKVNDLLALCDELAAKLRQAEADSEKLMNAAVRHVLDTIAGKEKSQSEIAPAP